MKTRCEFPEIRTFEKALSAVDFESGVELSNVPAVFRGCISDWDACSKWNPSNGGLVYLEGRVGPVEVEAMLSRVAPVFYGDIRSHERVSFSFSDFIRFCKQQQMNKDDDSIVNVEPESMVHNSIACGTGCNCPFPEDAVPRQIYLAQVPIMNVEKEEKVQLEILREDIQTPKLLGGKSLSSINFWMNSAQARSSTHYDPHHNLLCVVAGRKKVILWAPSASPMLYPMPIYGEASNHSSVALEDPNLSDYPRAKHSLELSQKVILEAGDALFIPEGWFHQVDSDELTIAVNFWWRSSIMSNLSEHMDSYYLRRIIRRCEHGQELILPKPSSTGIKRLTGNMSRQSQIEEAAVAEPVYHHSDRGSNRNTVEGDEPQQRTSMHELEPCALQALNDLISLVHDHVNAADLSQQTSSSCSSAASSSGNSKIPTTELFCLEDDRVAQILWSLDPSMLQDVLLAMACNFPRTLEALIIHMLSPVAAEVLTQKFDEMDQHTNEEDRNKFYREFYGALDDQFAAMDAMLSRKESFAFKAFKNVLDKYLGVNIDSSTRNSQQL